MKKRDFDACVVLALSKAGLPGYLSEEMSIFDGYGLDTQTRFATKEQMASLIRGECITLGGTLLMPELEALRKISKRFKIVPPESSGSADFQQTGCKT
jgi:hypothetical protein